jgi:hydroxyacylglutathione hydrolase
VLFRQVLHPDLGCASYVVADTSAGIGAVVDPKWSIDEYLNLARHHGFRIAHVVETHNHADHMSGRSRLVEATGADCWVSPLADAAYPHRPFADGDEVELGAVRLRALHVPGHRPEHTAVLIVDTGRSPQPCAVLTGDSLFVNDVARPDLAIDEEDGARDIFASLQDRLLSLPGETEVWPGHLGGSLCGGPGMDMKVCSTLAYERAHNRLLAETDQQRFVKRAISSLGPQPPNFRAIVELNTGELVTEGVEVLPLTPRQVEHRRAGGSLVVDARTDLQFDEAHIPQAVCIPALQAGFGTRLAWLADREQEVILVGRDDEDARRAAKLALSVGIRRLGGFLAGGMTEWRREKRPVERIERLEVEELHERSSSDPGVQILDVRERAEREERWIPGSLFEPWHDIHELPDGLDPGRPVAVLCSSGQRATVAASLLQRHGAEQVLHVVDGGVPKWERLGYPTERPARAAA